MKFSILAVIVASATTVPASLHNYCSCALQQQNYHSYFWEFGEDATKYACGKYRARNAKVYDNAEKKKLKQWDTCPDCIISYYGDMDGKNETACYSKEVHMGGDEWNYYCSQKEHVGYCRKGKAIPTGTAQPVPTSTGKPV